MMKSPGVFAAQWDEQVYQQVRRGIRPAKLRNTSSVFRGWIIICMAGVEAENVLLGSNNGGDTRDRDQIALFGETREAFSYGEEWERYEPRMRRQTRHLVHKHRDKNRTRGESSA
jgi:hypothetical protein